MAKQKQWDPVTIFKRTDGLNTRHDPARLAITEKGTAELAVAVNVNVDQSGRISRRKGYSRLADGKDFHSFHVAGDYALCVQEDSLMAVEQDFSMTEIRRVTKGRRMSYQQVADTIYYANGLEKGMVVNRENHPWQAGEYVGPETTKRLSDPPAGHLICLHNGRMYIAQDIADSNGTVHHVLWHTEPFAYSWVDFARNFIPLEYRVVTLDSLPGSLVAGTTGGVFVFTGSGPEDFAMWRLSDSPVVAGTAARIRSDKVGEGEASGEVILLVAEEGICMVGSDRYFSNLTHRKIDMPRFSEGCAAIVNNRYTTCLYK